MSKLRKLSHGNSIALQSAGITLLTGTVLFVCTLLFGMDALLGTGILFLVCAVFINGSLFLGTIIRSLNRAVPVRETLLTMYLLLLNIPVAILFITMLSHDH